MYGSEAAALRKRQAAEMEVAKEEAEVLSGCD